MTNDLQEAAIAAAKCPSCYPHDLHDEGACAHCICSDGFAREFPFAWITDVHIDHLGKKDFEAFCKALQQVKQKDIVLTGDISVANRLTVDLAAMSDSLLDVNKKLYFTLGNHDFWGDAIEGSIRLAKQVSQVCPSLVYLPAAGVIPLSDGVHLMGVNGYADARAGDFQRSNVSLVDYRACYSLRGLSKVRLQRVLQDLGEESAFEFGELFSKVPADAKRLYLATHVPPFEECNWHNDKPSGIDFMPHFVNVALGREILHAAKLWPMLDIIVLAGHVHWGTKARIASNVSCFVGWATYGKPEIQDLSKIPDRTLPKKVP